MKLNNRGYVLVEIILASVIAFGIAYYMLDLTIKLKNKNDDLLAETLVKTDMAIIQNKLAIYIDDDAESFDCSNIIINDKVITYKNSNNLIDIVNKYTSIDGSRDDLCTVEDNIVHIIIPLSIEQLNKNFDVDLYYVIRPHYDSSI